MECNLKCVNNVKKIEAIHDEQNIPMMAARWWHDSLGATDLQWLQDTSYNQIDHKMCPTFAKRLYVETSSIHLPFGGDDSDT